MRVDKIFRGIIMSLFFPAFLSVTIANSQAISGDDVHRMSIAEIQQKFYKPEIKDKISIEISEATLQESLKEISKKTGLKLTYRGDILSSTEKRVRFNNELVSVSEALEYILMDTDLDYSISGDGYLLITKKENEHKIIERQELIVGRVVDALTNEALPGVNILVKGTTMGTATDLDGNFQLQLPALTGSLIVTYIGYERQEVDIMGRNNIIIQLQPAEIGLDEVVVVGYGTQQRSDLTGSVVQISTSKAIQGQSFSNINQALQGKISGVTFTNTSGDPGAQVQVRIRGLSTFGESGPLYIVDGLPMDQSDVNSINPNDIESTSVLKDASAAAIYGARAANGVIILTTKKGANRPVQVEFNSYYGIQSFNRFIPLLNSQQYADLVNEAHVNGNFFPLQPAFSDPEVLKVDTDWQDAAINAAPIQDHSFTISGGNDGAIYSVTGGMFDQESILAFRSLRRYYTRVNTQFDLGKLTVGQSLILSRQEGLNLGYATNLDLAYMLGAAPTMLVYDPTNDSGYGGPSPERTGVNNRDNILGRRDMRRDYRYQNRLRGTLYANYEILPNLEYRINLGLNAGANRNKFYTPMFEMDNRGSNTRSLSTGMSESYEYLVENTLTFTKEFGVGHRMTLLAGATQQNYTTNNISGNIRDFPSNEIQVISAGTGPYSLNGNASDWALRSFLGRANFTLFDKYLITATIRRDGSSRFGPSNRYGNFPSFAVGWNIHEESFMADVPLISELKLRASWGILGNQDIGNYSSQTVVSTSSRYYFGSDVVAPAATVNSLGNPDLKWEETVQSNVGVDLSLFNDKILLTADYWVKDTNGVLVRTPISTTTGFARDSGPYQNAAELRNNGFEFLVEYREGQGDFNYSISANLNTVRNKVLSLGSGESIINMVDNVYYSGVFVRTRVGDPMSHFYGYVMDGIFQNQAEIDAHALQPGAEPGDVRFKDLNGDGIVDANDRTNIGDPWPNFDYGMAFNASYKNFDMNLTLYGVQGKQLYDAQGAYLEQMNGEWNQKATTLKRWKGEGTSNTMPRAVRGGANDNARPSTRFVENADFLRVQNLQIGYTLPPSLINQFGARSLRVYFNAQNLLTLTKYPNYNVDTLGGQGYNDDSMNPLGFGVDTGSVPIPSIFQLGVNIIF